MIIYLKGLFSEVTQSKNLKIIKLPLRNVDLNIPSKMISAKINLIIAYYDTFWKWTETFSVHPTNTNFTVI